MARQKAAWLALLALASCGERPRLQVGEACTLNSDCGPTLVCRLERCRVECRGHRDCSPGLSCIRDESGLGACQIQDECELNSDCPEELVCRRGTCINACNADTDCPPETECLMDMDGVKGCADPSDTPCRLNSDCEWPKTCAVDGRCRPECETNRDCRDGRVCTASGVGPLVCMWPADAGAPMDAGGTDAGTDGGMDAATDGGIDGGTDGGTDAGPDGGMDAGIDSSVDAGWDAGIDAGPPASLGVMSSGYQHNCAAPTPSDPRCWGSRIDSAFGVTWSSVTPEVVPGLSDVQMLVSGANHTCAGTSGALYCWGRNEEDQLGPSAAGGYVASPVSVPGIVPRAIAAGNAHTCALDVSGDVSCWGANGSGQLGDGTTTSRPSPTAVDLGGVAATDISARGTHSCALLTTGEIWCWGRNFYGQLGRGGTSSEEPNPAPVAGLPEAAVEVDAGSEYTCARLETGDVWCWGDNYRHQLATTSVMSSPTPLRVMGVADVAELEASVAHVCARDASGGVQCWGANAHGQVGTTPSTSVEVPTAVAGLPAATEIAVGDNHTCARTAPTTFMCWGRNDGSQLGHGGAGGPTPVAVTW